MDTPVLMTTQGFDEPTLMTTKKQEATANRVKDSLKQITAETITKAISDMWTGKDTELATAARISSNALSKLKTRGTDHVTNVLKAVCNVLNIDPSKILKGQIEKREPNHQSSQLLSVAKSFIGGPDEQLATELLLTLKNRSRTG